MLTLREWCTAPDVSVNRIVPGVATLNGCIYVVGGEQESNSLASGEFYDPKDEQWSDIANMEIARCEFGLCALNGYLYALGGWVGGDIGGTIERYDPNMDQWRLVGNLQEPRFSMGVVPYEGIHLFITYKFMINTFKIDRSNLYGWRLFCESTIFTRFIMLQSSHR